MGGSMKKLISRMMRQPHKNYMGSMIRMLGGLLVLLGIPQLGLQAAQPNQTPTFSNEVARVLQQKCQR